MSPRPRASVVVLAASALALACGCHPKPPPASPPISIGIVLPDSGVVADLGQAAADGARLAIQGVNDGGRLLGRDIEPIAKDDRGTAATADSVVGELLTDSKPCIVIGGLSDAAASRIATACQKESVPFISPFATDPRIAATGADCFSMAATDAQQGQAMARYAIEDLHAHTAAIVTDSTSPSSEASSQSFGSAFEAAGGAVVERADYSIGQTDFLDLARQLTRRAPDVVYVPGFQPEAGLLLQQAEQAGAKATFLGSDAWLRPPPPPPAPNPPAEGPAANEPEKTGPPPPTPPQAPPLHGYATGHFAADAPWPAAAAFAQSFETRYKRSPDAFSALAYDAVRLAADAIRRCGTDKPAAVRDALAKTTGFEGATGTLSLSEARTPVKPVLVLSVQDAQAKFVKALQP